jgi:flagellar basal-body rod modification protein FlgD
VTRSIDESALQRIGLTPEKSTAKTGPNDRLGQPEFLRLMVTQLTNQDPFKPMESGEFLGQLAQFGTVSGIADMQKALGTLAGSLNGNQALKAATLIDRDVLVPAKEGWLPPGGAMRGAIDVPPGTHGVKLEILDLAGGRLGEVPVDFDANGRASFAWDGALASGGAAGPGFYALRATGARDGRSEALDVMVFGRVESVGVGKGDGELSLTVTGLGQVDFARVREVAQSAGN